MTMHEIERLVSMANQIARNMGAWGDEDAVAAKIGEHLAKFWTPAMRERLLRHQRDGGSGLLPGVHLALDTLAGGTAGRG